MQKITPFLWFDHQAEEAAAWQIVPVVLFEMLQDKNPKKSKSVMRALLQMKKPDIWALQRAYHP